MIVNHKYKFLFLKTRKTAGTSIEIALSQFCDGNDIITPITKEDERTRQELGFRGPQNYNRPLHSLSRSDWLSWLRTGRRKRFFNHASAQFIRDNIGEEIWGSYFKFCFERDPFDKAISRYYWSTREPRPEIAAYLDSAPAELLTNWDIYTIDDRIAVDFVGRYESLSDHIALLKDKLGLHKNIDLPRAKGGYRNNREHYSKILNERARARIENVCAKEIAALGYRWTESEE
jgi:hypothetical protein